MKKDRKQRLMQMISKELDVRDYWLGIRRIRKGYTPIPYTLIGDDGRRFKVGDKAKEAAKFLSTKQWGKNSATMPISNKPMIFQDTHPIDIDAIDIGEIEIAIKNSKDTNPQDPIWCRSNS